MNGEEFKSVILFMANRWSKEVAIAIYGKVLGEHFWNKWVGQAERMKNPDDATMRLFYEMTSHNLDLLVNYAIEFYKK